MKSCKIIMLHTNHFFPLLSLSLSLSLSIIPSFTLLTLNFILLISFIHLNFLLLLPHCHPSFLSFLVSSFLSFVLSFFLCFFLRFFLFCLLVTILLFFLSFWTTLFLLHSLPLFFTPFSHSSTHSPKSPNGMTLVGNLPKGGGCSARAAWTLRQEDTTLQRARVRTRKHGINERSTLFKFSCMVPTPGPGDDDVLAGLYERFYNMFN